MIEPKVIRCIAVDDEPPALRVLQTYIGSFPRLELMGMFANAVDALAALQRAPVELMFLDIQMPKLLGTDLVRSLTMPPRVIFTTAYRKFAVEGFELNAVDYLLKPISFDRFVRAVNKVMDTRLLMQTHPQGAASHSTFVSDEFLYVRAQRRIVKIPFNEILYIESLKDYVKVVSDSDTFVSKLSICTLEEALPKDRFIRVHRSFIVAIRKVFSYGPEMVQIGKVKIPVSRTYRQKAKDLIVTGALRQPGLS